MNDVLIFWIVIIINTLIAVLYWLFFTIFKDKSEAGFTTRAIVMIICPVVAPGYFFLGWLFRKVFFHNPVDLVDVIFSKDREKTLFKANEEGERNIVPVEEAVTVTDKHNARVLMLEVLKHDVRRTMVSISSALNSSDSEISHYAASVLQFELGKFRLSVQKVVETIDTIEEQLREAEDFDGELRTEHSVHFHNMLAERDRLRTVTQESDDDLAISTDKTVQELPESPKLMYADISPKLELSEDYAKHNDAAYEQGRKAAYGEEEVVVTLGQKLSEQMALAHKIIDDICCVLDQHVLSDMETEQYVNLITRLGELIEKRDVLTESELQMIAMNILVLMKHDDCLYWCEKLSRYYPESLECYSCKLKLYFTFYEREEFFRTLDEMKRAGVSLNHEMMEMVRVFM